MHLRRKRQHELIFFSSPILFSPTSTAFEFEYIFIFEFILVFGRFIAELARLRPDEIQIPGKRKWEEKKQERKNERRYWITISRS